MIDPRTPAEKQADRICCMRSSEQVHENIAAIKRAGRRLAELIVCVGDDIQTHRELRGLHNIETSDAAARDAAEKVIKELFPNAV